MVWSTGMRWITRCCLLYGEAVSKGKVALVLADGIPARKMYGPNKAF